MYNNPGGTGRVPGKKGLDELIIRNSNQAGENLIGKKHGR